MMHSFQKFCNSKATDLPITFDPDNVIVEEKYLDILDVTIKDLRGRREVFDEINVVYVENAINNVNLEEIADMDIPDGIFVRLAEGIFKKKVSELNADQQSIIKVLAVYICISI